MEYNLRHFVNYKGQKLRIVGKDKEDDQKYFLLDDTGLELGTKLRYDYNEIIYSSNVTENTKGRWVYENEIEPYYEEKTEPSTTINESGVWVRRFASGAIRSDDRGREKPSFVSPYAIKFIAKHFSANADFFNGNDSGKNYMKGITPKHIQDSLLRHTLDLQFAMLPGNEDIAATKKALVEIGANVVMALHQIGLAEDGKYVEVFEDLAYVKREEAYDTK